jgi:hypothetical protein
MVLGTPAYMSSEQASGIRSDQLDLRSDVYSLGIVVYEMLTGCLPFHSDTPLGYLRKHMLETPPPLRTVASGLPVPEPVEAVVLKALAKDRCQRFASALEFSSEFSRAVKASAPTEPLPTTRVMEPFSTMQSAPHPDPAEKAQAGRREREAAADIVARAEAIQADQAQAAEAERRNKATPEIDYIVREQGAPQAPRPVKAPAPIPNQSARQATPRPVTVPSSVRETGREAISLGPQAASRSARHGRTRFFKVGFWILGISEVLLILEGLTGAFRYLSHYDLMNWLSLIVGIGIGTAFVVINCRFLARRRYTELLWLSLVFAVMGIVANNVFWIALTEQSDYHLSYSMIGLLAMLRAFTLSSGPISSLIGPFIQSFLGSGFYYAGLVNIDCLLRIGFLIWALAKYHDGAPSPKPSA